MNKVFLIGRITKELELRYTKSNKPVCDFTLAVNRDKDNADFIQCQVWNKQAENLCEYQGKGSQIAIGGEIRIDTYDNNGEKRYKTFILVNQVEYLSNKQSTQENANKTPLKEDDNPYKQFGDSIKTESDIGKQIEIDDEDLPF